MRRLPESENETVCRAMQFDVSADLVLGIRSGGRSNRERDHSRSSVRLHGRRDSASGSIRRQRGHRFFPVDDSDIHGRLPNRIVPVGDYTVTADKQGFQKSVKKIHLDIAAEANVDFTLVVGQVSQEIRSGRRRSG